MTPVAFDCLPKMKFVDQKAQSQMGKSLCDGVLGLQNQDFDFKCSLYNRVNKRGLLSGTQCGCRYII
jgi:hypothetical protein